MYFFQQKVTEKSSLTVNSTSSTSYVVGPKVNDFDGKLSDRILKTQEFKNCLSREAASCSNQTATEKAKIEKDPSWCDEISADEPRAMCEESFAINSAIEKLDYSVCLPLKTFGQKDICLNLVTVQKAIKNSDINICEEYGFKNSTTSNSSLNKDLCKNQVLFNLPSEKINKEICKVFRESVNKSICEDFVKNNQNKTTPTVLNSVSVEVGSAPKNDTLILSTSTINKIPQP
jgi:hypothetical protein